MDNSSNSYEPMDIDHSNNSVRASSSASSMDISNTDLIDTSIVKTEKVDGTPIKVETQTFQPKKPHVQPVKKYHLKIERRSEKDNIFRRNIKLLAPILLILSISVITYHVVNFKCSEEIDFKKVQETLTRNLYGQSKAVNAMIESLQINDSSKILFLYGGTGVGKTFAASLILEKLWNCSNVYHYTMPGFANTFSSDFMLGLAFCKNSIVVVDDLTTSDMHIKTHIKDIIAKSDNLRKNITVILIFNCDNITKDFVKKCDQSFYEELKLNFSDVKAIKRFVKFDTLTEEHLRKCIEKELQSRPAVYNIDIIMKNFNVSLDGCKGVYKKISFLSVH